MTQKKSKQKRRQLDGILLFDKPKGITSNHALQRIKRIFNADKAGHSGTLDPMATGMLPICFGEATKFAGQLLDNCKTYQFTCKLGEKTSTGDEEGEIVEMAHPPQNLTTERLTAIFQQFIGEILQVPPMVSALHHNGERLYELARKGIEVERKARSITIYSLELDAIDGYNFTATVTCSKGTYVRVLAEDIALKLDTFGHLIMLRRQSIAPFNDYKMVTVEMLENCHDDVDKLDQFLLPIDSALIDLPILTFNQEEAVRILHGQRIHVEIPLKDNEQYRLYDDQDNFLGIGVPNTPTSIGPKRIIQRN